MDNTTLNIQVITDKNTGEQITIKIQVMTNPKTGKEEIKFIDLPDNVTPLITDGKVSLEVDVPIERPKKKKKWWLF